MRFRLKMSVCATIMLATIGTTAPVSADLLTSGDTYVFNEVSQSFIVDRDPESCGFELTIHDSFRIISTGDSPNFRVRALITGIEDASCNLEFFVKFENEDCK